MPKVEDQPLVIDEHKRLSRHEEVKGAVESRIQDEIRQTADGGRDDHAQVKAVAGHLRQKAISSVADTELELERARKTARLSQFVDYVFYVAYGLIGLEIALELLGARQASGFKRFLDLVTTPLLAPFKGLMPDPHVGSFQLMLSYIIGLVVYVLLHLAVNGLLRLFASRKAMV
jgi:uncharacterized protein YggT (Ycf19 family)